MGTDADELHRLARCWPNGFDWRAQEAAINALPSHFETVAGTPVHYLGFDGEAPEATPIVLTHGWPSTFLEHLELAKRLARPSEYGAAGEPAFSVVVPSLPGFPFSPRRASRAELTPRFKVQYCDPPIRSKSPMTSGCWP